MKRKKGTEKERKTERQCGNHFDLDVDMPDPVKCCRYLWCDPKLSNTPPMVGVWGQICSTSAWVHEWKSGRGASPLSLPCIIVPPQTYHK